MRIDLEKRTIVKIILGSILGVFAIYFAFKGVSISRMVQLISQANIELFVLGVSLVLLNVFTIALRWWVLLLRKWHLGEYKFLLEGIYLGQMFNILLPARLGELARVYFVSENVEGTTKSRLLGSVALEKMVDIITFAGGLFLLVMAISLPTWIADPGRTLIWLAAISLLGLMVLTIWGRSLLNGITPLFNRLPYSWGKRVSGMMERAITGFDSMRDWRRQFHIWALSLFSLFLSTLTNYVILQALGIQTPFTAALFVLIVLQVGSAPPSAPGKLGVFHYLTVLALSTFEVEKDIALAYSVLLYLVALSPKIVIGVGVLLFSRWKFPNYKLLND